MNAARNWIGLFFFAGIATLVAGVYIDYGVGPALLALAASFFALSFLLGVGLRNDG